MPANAARNLRVVEVGTPPTSLPLPSRPAPATSPGLPAWPWTSASLGLHLLLALLFIWQFAARGQPPVPNAIKAVLIVRASTSTSAAAQPEQAPPEPQPAPKPAEPKEAPKPAPKPKPDKATAKPEADPKPATPPPSTTTDKVGNEGESAFSLMLDDMRGNWLQPAGPRIPFVCKLKIDYQPGGIITNVSLLRSCGNPKLDDSVLRAAWKTQPLPLPPNAARSGSIELEFTP